MTARELRIILAGLLAAAVLVPTGAFADGDPASDVLLGENVFYPYSPPVSPALQSTLNAETSAASRAHFPIKVALIASPADLGVIPSLFGKPQKYAAFLDQEISYQTWQPLLVVMAAGYGVKGLPQAATIAAGSLTKPSGSQSNDLARAAIAAVPKLAAAAGHPIRNTADTNNGASSSRSRTLLVALLGLGALTATAVLITIRRRQTRPH